MFCFCLQTACQPDGVGQFRCSMTMSTSQSVGLFFLVLSLLHQWPSDARSVADSTVTQTHNSLTKSPACHDAGSSRPSYISTAADTCREDVFLLVVVCSSLNHVEQRNAIRSSWASDVNKYQPRTRVVFLVGSSEPSQVPDIDVAMEIKTHGDVIQMDMVDTYANLSLKSIALLHWVDNYCKHAKFVLKTDDDMFINIPVLYDNLRNNVHKRFLMGYIITGAQPIRDTTSKYYTPPSKYNKFMYPTYISGTAYVISGDLVHDLYCATARTELFWLEDVYITGMCAKTVDATHIFNGKFSYKQRPPDPCLYRVIISMHGLTPASLLAVWRQMNVVDMQCNYSQINVSNP